ncbi:hypothetical protein EPUL_006067, partial [Erysiphe pulchra]
SLLVLTTILLNNPPEELFESFEAAIESINTFAASEGYAVIKLQSIYDKKVPKTLRRHILAWDRHWKHKSLATNQSRLRFAKKPTVLSEQIFAVLSRKSYYINNCALVVALSLTYSVEQQLTHNKISGNTKPSFKATSIPDDSQDTPTLQIVQISDIFLASSDDAKSSLKEANRKTEVWTLSERLGNIEKMISLPNKLTSSNNNYFYECIKRLIQLTDTSCVFLTSVPITKATTMWSAWWVSKLRDAAPYIKTTDQDSPRIVLTTI